MDFQPQELFIAVLARLVGGARHAASGMTSPMPATAILMASELARRHGEPPLTTTVLGSRRHSVVRGGSRELFDLAGSGRLDVFFLSGGQIDGAGNINLVGIGDYPGVDVRFPGSYGSAYMYFVVPKVILFREEHSRRVMVPKVDFISAPGASKGVYRPGGPTDLVTPLCHFSYLKERTCFRLESVHPGHTLEEVNDNTAFDFDCPADVPETNPPSDEELTVMRGVAAEKVAEVYPAFAKDLWNMDPGESAQSEAS